MRKGLGIIITLLIISILLSGCTELSTLSMSGTSIPVEFAEQNNPGGYSGKYYVATAIVAGTDSQYKIVPKGGKYSDSLVLQLSGLESVYTAPLLDDPSPLTYKEVDYTWIYPYTTQKPVPYYSVDMINHKLITNSNVKLGWPSGSSETKTVSSDGNGHVITFIVNDHNNIPRTIYVKFQSVVLKSGDLPPAESLVTLQNGELVSNYKLISYNNLDGALNAAQGWNTYYYPLAINYGFYGLSNEVDEWKDCYNWMSSAGKIPEKKPAIATSYDVTLGTDAILEIFYPSTVFAQEVTFYVPDELAEYIGIFEEQPGFAFDKISNIQGIEGQSQKLTVSGTAIGSGTINLGVGGSSIATGSWVGGSQKEVVKGRDYEFDVVLQFNTGLTADAEFDAYVDAQGSGLGTYSRSDFKVYLIDKDTVTPDEKHNVRVYAIHDTTGDKVMSAPLYIGYGSDRLIGYGDSTKTGVIEGPYEVYSENVTGWYAAYTADHPKTISVDGTEVVEILFTRSVPEYEDDDDVFSIDLLLPVVAILILIGYGVMMQGGGIRLLEPIRPMLSNPYFWLFLTALVVGVVGWMIYQDMSAKADSFIFAIEGIKLI